MTYLCTDYLSRQYEYRMLSFLSLLYALLKLLNQLNYFHEDLP